jgi:hypothetical protein
MRAGDHLTDGVFRKFDFSLAGGAIHSHKSSFRFAVNPLAEDALRLRPKVDGSSCFGFGTNRLAVLQQFSVAGRSKPLGLRSESPSIGVLIHRFSITMTGTLRSRHGTNTYNVPRRL